MFPEFWVGGLQALPTPQAWQRRGRARGVSVSGRAGLPRRGRPDHVSVPLYWFAACGTLAVLGALEVAGWQRHLLWTVGPMGWSRYTRNRLNPLPGTGCPPSQRRSHHPPGPPGSLDAQGHLSADPLLLSLPAWAPRCPWSLCPPSLGWRHPHLIHPDSSFPSLPRLYWPLLPAHPSSMSLSPGLG